MEFIQAHVPTIPNWNVIGQTVTENTNSLVKLFKDYWVAITIILLLTGVILWHFASKKPKSDNPLKSDNSQ